MKEPKWISFEIVDAFKRVEGLIQGFYKNQVNNEMREKTYPTMSASQALHRVETGRGSDRVVLPRAKRDVLSVARLSNMVEPSNQSRSAHII